jgi:hypothetical protein
MVYITLIYGYALTVDHIEDLFDRDEYPDLYKEQYDWQVIDAVYKMLKNHVDPKIKMIVVDYEFTVNYGKFNDRGESTLLVGIELLRCKAHYNGTAMIHDVTNDVKETLTNFININLGIYDNLGTHVYIDAEK